MTRRLFLGIPVPKTVQKKVTNGLTPLRELYPSWRYVFPENYHVTVSFFGSLKTQQILHLTEVISDSISSVCSFTFHTDQLIFAPPKKSPRMLWVIFQKNSEFDKLVESVETTISQHIVLPDFRKSHAPIPHITLARFNQVTQLPKVLPSLDETIEVTALELFESVLSSNGPSYHKIHEFRLSD